MEKEDRRKDKGRTTTRKDQEKITIKLATFNIRSGCRAGNLEAALRSLEEMNIDVAILT
jgi:hypothetical protein